MKKTIVIVGGVAGGSATATRIRRLDEEADIIMIERGSHISFANCGLPYYIGDVIQNRENLFIQSPAGMKRRYNIDVRVQQVVRKIIKENKTVEVENCTDGTVYYQHYDKLVLTPGAEPISIGKNGIYSLRTVEDADRIKSALVGSSDTVIIGGGFIGIELAENLCRSGINVTLVEQQNAPLPTMDRDMCGFLIEHIRAKGVRVMLNSTVSDIQVSDAKKIVKMQNGETLICDMVVSGIGVRPETKLAREAGLQLNERGAILVNRQMQTNDPDIYAVGDAVALENLISRQQTTVALAGLAARCARVAADNICGVHSTYTSVLGTNAIKVFDLTSASTGLTEKQLKAMTIPYEKCFVHSSNHVGYYPGASPLTLKLLFDPVKGQILGAQAIGMEGTDKRIDVIAAAISKGDTVYDLQNIELCYAPPFGAAKDPVNIAGYVAGNMLDNTMPYFQWHDIEKLTEQDILLDVRTRNEHKAGHIEGSLLIPVDELRERLNELPKDRNIYVYCRVGLRGYLATRILMQNGYKVKNLVGGYRTYEAATCEGYDIYWN